MTARFVLVAIALNCASFPISVCPQQPNQMAVVGLLMTSVGPNDPIFGSLRKGLRDGGYVEGQNIRFEFRGAQGKAERLPHLADELVQLKVDAIVVSTEAALLAAKRSTSTIPIVAALFDYDPVAAGVVASLAHPGGNITGIFSRAPELIGKRLELLKETVPNRSRVAVLYDSYGRRQLEDIEPAARSLGIQLHLTELKPPYDFNLALKLAKQKKAGAAMLLYSPVFFVERDTISQEALENRVPMIAYISEFARAGFLMSYGSDGMSRTRRLSAVAVARVA